MAHLLIYWHTLAAQQQTWWLATELLEERKPAGGNKTHWALAEQ